MESRFELIYSPTAFVKDKPQISSEVKQRIRRTIENKLPYAPEHFGEPLRGTLKGYWKLRVGDYRVLYKITGRKVEILAIGHRSQIYKRFL